MVKKIGILTAANTAINIVVSMLVGVIISRGLSVPDRGVVYLILQVTLICSVLLALGTSQTIVYSQKKSDDSDIKSFTIACIICFIFGITSCIFHSYWPNLMQKVFGLSLSNDTNSLMLIATLTMVYFSIFNSRVQLNNDGIEQSLNISILGNLVYLVCLSLVFYIGFLSVDSCLVIIILSYCIRILFCIILIGWRQYFNFKFNFEFIKYFFKNSIAFWINVFCFIVFSKINLLIAGRYLNSNELGVYSVSLTVIEIVGILPSAIGTVLFPYMVKTDFQEDDGRIKKIARLMFELSATVSVIVAILGLWLITFLYGDSYKAAYLPLLLMLPGAALLSVVYSFTNFLNSTGKTRKSNFVYVVCIAFSCISSIPLIKKYGMNGASIAYTLSCSLTFMTFLFVSNNGFKNGLEYIFVGFKNIQLLSILNRILNNK